MVQWLRVCMGDGFDSWLGNSDLKCGVVWPKKKKKKKGLRKKLQREIFKILNFRYLFKK